MIPTIQTIVVGVDTLRRTDPVLESAIALAETLGASLHVVHGYMLTDPLLDAYARAGYLGEHTLANFGKELQASLSAMVASLTQAPNVVAEAVAGPPATALLQVAEEAGADLIVVGSTRHGTFPLSLLGSTCKAVLRRSPVPVLVMRPNRSATVKKILAPTDLSPLSDAALPWAFALSGSGARPMVRAMLVINESLMLLPLEQRILEQVAEDQLTEFTSKSGLSADIKEQIVRKGDPATEIVSEAALWGADLVVLGTHARRGMERLLLGSVAETALKSAPCHVLVVPPEIGPTGGQPTEDMAREKSGRLPVQPAA